MNILNLLVETGTNGLPAGDISLALGVPQNTLSFHLSHLEAADLVHRRRSGRFIIYSANHKTIDSLILYMGENMREKIKDKSSSNLAS